MRLELLQYVASAKGGGRGGGGGGGGGMLYPVAQVTLTAAGEAIPVQLIALVTATQEGPIGVEAALLTWGSHVTLIHI